MIVWCFAETNSCPARAPSGTFVCTFSTWSRILPQFVILNLAYARCTQLLRPPKGSSNYWDLREKGGGRRKSRRAKAVCTRMCRVVKQWCTHSPVKVARLWRRAHPIAWSNFRKGDARARVDNCLSRAVHNDRYRLAIINEAAKIALYTCFTCTRACACVCVHARKMQPRHVRVGGNYCSVVTSLPDLK